MKKCLNVELQVYSKQTPLVIIRVIRGYRVEQGLTARPQGGRGRRLNLWDGGMVRCLK